MPKRKEDLILNAINYDPFGDIDKDGVQNILDCKPYDKTRDGFFRDLGGAIKTEIKGEVGEAKERLLKGIAGEERREQRKKLREAERDAYIKEAKEMAEERGKEKAQRKFEKHRIGEGFGEKVETLEELEKRLKKRPLTLEEKVEKFAKKTGKHGKGMLEGDDLLSKKSTKKSVRMVTPLTISVPMKPVLSTKSQKPLIAPLTISMQKRTKKSKALLDVGF